MIVPVDRCNVIAVVVGLAPGQALRRFRSSPPDREQASMLVAAMVGGEWFALIVNRATGG